jgi:hypothetical protein
LKVVLFCSEEGKVRKVLKVEPLPDGSGHFFNLSNPLFSSSLGGEIFGILFLLYDVITCECDAVIVNFYSLEVVECYILKSNSILWIHPFLFQTFFTFIIIMGI